MDEPSLKAWLTGCAGGVAVVNIDNGFAAGYMMAMILRNLERKASASQSRAQQEKHNNLQTTVDPP